MAGGNSTQCERLPNKVRSRAPKPLCDFLARDSRRYLASIVLSFALPVFGAESLISYPTDLAQRAKMPDARVAILKDNGSIQAGDAQVTFTVVSIKVPAERDTRGLKLELIADSFSDVVLLSKNEAALLRDEIEMIEVDGPCHARRGCVFGVARCRPSQTVVQAICPGFFVDIDGDSGLMLSTPVGGFKFPDVSVSSLYPMLRIQ